MRLLTTLFIAASLAGCTADAPADPPWHGRDLSQEWQSLPLAARQSFEINFDRQAGQAVDWDWFVDERLVIYFEAHTHVGDEHQVFVETYAEENASRIDVDADGTYSLLWANPHGQDATLWYQVPADGRSGA